MGYGILHWGGVIIFSWFLVGLTSSMALLGGLGTMAVEHIIETGHGSGEQGSRESEPFRGCWVGEGL